MSGYYKLTCDLQAWDDKFVANYSKHKLIQLDHLVAQLFLKYDGDIYRQISRNDFDILERKLPYMDVCQFRVSYGAKLEFIGKLADAKYVWENL